MTFTPKRPKFRQALPHIRMSDIPADTWMDIVLVNPNEQGKMVIPRRGVYYIYEAYFPFEKTRRHFNWVVPANKFISAIACIPKSMFEGESKPMRLTFKRNKHYDFSIKKFTQDPKEIAKE